jgi:hypothetical protein
MGSIGNPLASLFSVHVGRDDQAEVLDRIRQDSDPTERDELRADFGKALADPTFDWIARFDEEEVDAEADTSAAARAFVIERIWTPLFGPEPVPGGE